MSIKIKAVLNDLQAYKPGKPIEEVQKELGLTSIAKLASNENPLGSSKAAKAAAIAALSDTSIYPDGYAVNLRAELADFYKVDGEQLVIGAGLDEVIQIVSRAVLTAGDNIVQATPTFSQYALHADIEGVEVKSVPVDTDGFHDLKAMMEAVDHNTKILWLCNPNNPTGTYFSHEELINVLSRVPDHVLVIVDEAYAEYAIAEDYPDTMPLIEKHSNLMVMRTFSKAYGLAALRIGFGVTSKKLNDKLNVVRLPFNTSRVAQSAASVALANQAFIAECRKNNRLGMAQWEAFLSANNYDFYPSQTNFIFFNIERETAPVFDALLKRGYIVRAGLRPGWLRITIGTAEQNEGCIAALKAILAN